MKQLIHQQHNKTIVPGHIAIIPDGNRRWARSKGLSAVAGHEKSASLDNMIPLIETARSLGVTHMTFWAFSTENWKRSKTERAFLFNLIKRFALTFKEYALKNNIRFRHFGRSDRIPSSVATILSEIETETQTFTGFNVHICLDYGGRDELVRAVNKLISEGVTEINEESLAAHLDSCDVPDPDLVIRTSGEQRTSGFMPFQSSYAELLFEQKPFPEFTPEDLSKAIDTFAERKRNFGK